MAPSHIAESIETTLNHWIYQVQHSASKSMEESKFSNYQANWSNYCYKGHKKLFKELGCCRAHNL